MFYSVAVILFHIIPKENRFSFLTVTFFCLASIHSKMSLEMHTGLPFKGFHFQVALSPSFEWRRHSHLPFLLVERDKIANLGNEI